VPEDGTLHPAAECDFVVQRVERDAAKHQMQVTGGAEIANEIVGDAVRQLLVFRRVAEQADDHADYGIHGLAAERGQTVD
jgi:hypothetical protein